MRSWFSKASNMVLATIAHSSDAVPSLLTVRFPQLNIHFRTGNPACTKALAVLDEDVDQYIHDNTDDEFTHFTFINAYLVSKGAELVNLDKFRTLPSSKATGAPSKSDGADEPGRHVHPPHYS